MIHRILAALAALLLFTAVSQAQGLSWPDDLVRLWSQTSEALERAENLQARHEAYWRAEADIRAYDDIAPGAELTRRMVNMQMAAEAAIAELSDALSQLEGAAGGDLSPQAAGFAAAVGAVQPHIPPLPSAAYKFVEATNAYDKTAEAKGIPKVREAIALFGGEKAKAVSEALGKLEKAMELYDKAEAAAKGDPDAVNELARTLAGMVPAGVAPSLAGPPKIAFNDLTDWSKEMYETSTEGVYIVRDAIKRGRVDTKRLAKFTQKLEDLRRGPWDSDTAREFAKSWCDKLPPVVSDLCKKVFEKEKPPTCADIDCDCESISGGIIIGPLKVQCELHESELRQLCESHGEVVGSCDPGARGDAAFPKKEETMIFLGVRLCWRQILLCVALMVSGLIFPAGATAQAADTESVVTEIRKTYATCRTIRAAEDTKRIKLYGAIDDPAQAPQWFPQEPKDKTIVDWLTLFATDGEVRAADLVRATPSGDWSRSHDYCFRADGSLAFIHSVLRTHGFIDTPALSFNGTLRVEDRLYYDPDGNEIRKIRRVFDVETNKPFDGVVPSFQPVEIMVFKTTADLLSEVEDVLPKNALPSRAKTTVPAPAEREKKAAEAPKWKKYQSKTVTLSRRQTYFVALDFSMNVPAHWQIRETETLPATRQAQHGRMVVELLPPQEGAPDGVRDKVIVMIRALPLTSVVTKSWMSYADEDVAALFSAQKQLSRTESSARAGRTPFMRSKPGYVPYASRQSHETTYSGTSKSGKNIRVKTYTTWELNIICNLIFVSRPETYETNVSTFDGVAGSFLVEMAHSYKY